MKGRWVGGCGGGGGAGSNRLRFVLQLLHLDFTQPSAQADPASCVSPEVHASVHQTSQVLLWVWLADTSALYPISARRYGQSSD